ncbi:MAG: hypothetical protein ACI9G1_001680 [Pirellulaceae bacterium]|jgi:hypothetical protein
MLHGFDRPGYCSSSSTGHFFVYAVLIFILPSFFTLLSVRHLAWFDSWFDSVGWSTFESPSGVSEPLDAIN